MFDIGTMDVLKMIIKTKGVYMIDLELDFRRLTDSFLRFIQRIHHIENMTTGECPASQGEVAQTLMDLKASIIAERINTRQRLSRASIQAGGAVRVEDIFTSAARQVETAINFVSMPQRQPQESAEHLKDLQISLKTILQHATAAGGLKRLDDIQIGLIKAHAELSVNNGRLPDGSYPSLMAQ